MTPISDDITPVCEQFPRAWRKSQSGPPTDMPPASTNPPNKLILRENFPTRVNVKAPERLLSQQIPADSDCIQRASVAASLPSGCELPHCHHASSLGPYRG
jgi:hypothetical protein